jgi:hypothetical protein
MDQMSCFGEDHGTLGSLMRTVIERKENAPAESYTKVRMYFFICSVCLCVCVLKHAATVCYQYQQRNEMRWPPANCMHGLFSTRPGHALMACTSQRLFDDEALLRSKLLEECEELLAAKDNKEVWPR